MIYVYEPWASKSLHIEFIKAFLLSLPIEQKEIVYFGEKQQIQILQKIDEFKEVNFKIIEIPDYDSDGRKLYKIIQEYKNLYFLKKQIENNLLIITNGLPQTIIFSKFLLRNKKVYFVMHGHLAAISNEQKFKIWNMGFYMKTALSGCQDNFKFIVLGDCIRNNAIKIMPNLKNIMYSIEHPFLKKESMSFPASVYAKQNLIKIGTIGVGTEERGILLLNQMAELIKKENFSIQLFHVGKTTETVRNKLCSDITLPFVTNKMIPEEEYLREVNKLDFVVYLHDSNSYRLTASGALFDALSMGKPIITLQNSFFEYVLQKIDKRVGYMVENMDKMKDTFEEILSLNPSEYSQMVENCKHALDNFSPTIVKTQLEKIINEN